VTLHVHLDLETCSVVDLRRTGVYRYAEDPETHVICGCFSRSDTHVEDVDVWLPGMPVPTVIEQAVAEGGVFHCWNAQFEAAMWVGVLGPRHGWPVPAPEQFDCTMARSMYWGWPGSLDLAGEAMGLPVQKDKEGHALMLRMARPRAYNDDGTPRWWHLEDADKLNREVKYCMDDVRTEKLACHRLPPLPPQERKLWLLDQKMNRAGLPVDMVLVETMQRVARDAEAALKAAMKELTGGAVSGPQSHAALAKWLADQGIALPDLRADTVKTWIKKLPDCPARDVLILRRDGAKASVAKLKAFAEAVCRDGHVRGMLRYYGAGRTGRWSGAGGAKVQPHNLVRGTIKRPDTAIDMMLAGHGADDLELLFEDSALGVIASCLRGVFACP
jgi:DNA polymerase bacteriophage-type